MAFRYTLMGAVAFAVTSVAVAQAQSPFPPAGGQSQASPFPPAGTQALPQIGMPGRQQQPQQQEMPQCIKDFLSLREEVDKRFTVVKAMMEKKPTAIEACNGLTRFTQAETTLIKFAEKNASNCPFPAGLIDNIKASHVKSEDYKSKACTAAAQQQQRPARAAEPTLSDALSPPPLTKDTTSTGRGTLDSLSGNPLAR
jgi:hypothetical protein